MKIDPIDAIEAARPLVNIFRQLDVSCYFGGSLASSIHGNPRSTIDADVVADIRLEQVGQLCGQLDPHYFLDPETVRLATQTRDSFNLLNRQMLVKVDVFVLRHYRYEREAMERVKEIAIDDNQPDDRLPFCSAEDIILNKLMWYDQGGRVSERQWSDMQIVLKVQAGALDRAYLDKWAEHLDVAELLREAINQAGLDD